MTDDEVAYAVANWLERSTLASLRRRLAARVASGEFDQAVADRIFSKSPLQTDKSGRADMFWLTTPPPPPDHPLVEYLLNYWGGESAYWNLRKEGLPALEIGRPRIIEVALPLAATNDAYSAARATVSTYLRSMGENGDCNGIEVYAMEALPPAAILRVLSMGDRGFNAIGERFLSMRSPPSD